MKKLIILFTILVFGAVSIVNAQTAAGKKNTSDPQKVTQTMVIKSNGTAPAKIHPPVAGDPILEAPVAGQTKLGVHAPETNDPSYLTKIVEWRNNYPDEYNAYLKTQSNTGKK